MGERTLKPFDGEIGEDVGRSHSVGARDLPRSLSGRLGEQVVGDEQGRPDVAASSGSGIAVPQRTTVDYLFALMCPISEQMVRCAEIGRTVAQRVNGVRPSNLAEGGGGVVNGEADTLCRDVGAVSSPSPIEDRDRALSLFFNPCALYGR